MESKEFLHRLHAVNQQMSKNYPTKLKVQTFLTDLSNLLFPVCKEAPIIPEKMEVAWEHLKLSLKELLFPVKNILKDEAGVIVDEYFEKIPPIYDRLLLDAKAIKEFDPAAYSLEEIILAYPGFQAIMAYRLAHPLYKMGIPILPRLMAEYAHTNTGIDIHPGAKIGQSFFIDHGTGVVIGETAEIGNDVKIYQGVTIGALNVKKSEAKTKRHPTIEDNVIIYSGSTILGGKTVVGHNSVIGGNVWLTKSVDPYSIIYNISEIKVRNGNKKEPINFVI